MKSYELCNRYTQATSPSFTGKYKADSVSGLEQFCLEVHMLANLWPYGIFQSNSFLIIILSSVVSDL